MNTRLAAGFRTLGRLVGHLCWMAAIMTCCIWIQPLEGDSRQIKSVVAFAIAIGLTAAYGAFHIGWIEGHHAGWRAGSDKPNAEAETSERSEV